ncbi:osteoclast-associated immunoglobulin-like receptor [Numida meleagris]|uniref:osteoclast-associated immunoglobulin-like receptor n=1 Tax=Numida meleagris TaxID=8996 RepID=UPI000B3DA062|nr:osteoclast-associated immunoglobulin-like receptor [Numida meleagris]
METMTLALILGWCLVAAIRAQHLPRPSLSLHPIQRVSLGDTVSLRCHLPRPAAVVWLYQDGHLRPKKNTDKEQSMVEFSLVRVNAEDAEKYWCQYRALEPPGISDKSNPVEQVVTNHSIPPPGISLSPDEHVETGTRVTIRCWIKGYVAAFLLHKDGHLAPIQRQIPSGGGTATFTLSGVTPANSGTYRCSYRIRGCCPESSPLGKGVTLKVTPRPAHPGGTEQQHGNVSVTVAGGCAATLVFILIIIFFLLTARRRRMWTDASPRMPEVVQLQVPPVTLRV